MEITEITTIFSRSAICADRLYLSAFPKIERHTLREMHRAATKGRAEYLAFSEAGRFVGLAYMIVRGKVAFLLYFAVKDELRNEGRGGCILAALKERYEGRDLMLLIESLHEPCSNRDIRIRRKNFYLRNGMHDTGLIQNTFGGEATYDILNSYEDFDLEAFNAMKAEYPFDSYLEDVVPAGIPDSRRAG